MERRYLCAVDFLSDIPSERSTMLSLQQVLFMEGKLRDVELFTF